MSAVSVRSHVVLDNLISGHMLEALGEFQKFLSGGENVYDA